MGPHHHQGLCRYRSEARGLLRAACICLALPLLIEVTCSGATLAQETDDEVQAPASGVGMVAQVPAGPDSVEGTVVNRVTNEPIARALVYTPDNRYATLTDEHGHFGFKFPEQEKTPPPAAAPGDAESLRRLQAWYARNARPGAFLARKPGYLQDFAGGRLPDVQGGHAKIVLTLEPEALIVGHVQFPGGDSTERVGVLLYQQEFEEGHEHWTQASYFTTWSNGEFRFYDLHAGTYKLVTTEQLERDPATFNRQDQLYGYPPVFYPNASDLASAAPIRVAAGAKVDVNLTLTRRPYYPVKIPVANPPAAGGLHVLVYPRNHPGPGYSLGYDPGEEAIRGNLPEGDYTLKVSHLSEGGTSGLANFSVRGGPVDGPAIAVLPNLTVTVNISRELASAPTSGETTPGQAPENDGAREMVNVSLASAELFEGQNQSIGPAQVTGKDDTVVLKNVSSGRYWMNASAYNCYVARANWGGKDVLRQPMDVSADTTELPVEMLLRNDGATVSGSIKESKDGHSSTKDRATANQQTIFVYFIPLEEAAGEFRQTQATPGRNFQEMQLPPGTYRIVAFDEENGEIGRGNPDVRKQFEGKGVVVELSPNQSLELPSPLAVVSQP